MTDDDFRLHHSGEIREALIMIEGDGGGFELMKHGIMLAADHEMEPPYALVRSTDADRTYFSGSSIYKRRAPLAAMARTLECQNGAIQRAGVIVREPI